MYNKQLYFDHINKSKFSLTVAKMKTTVGRQKQKGNENTPLRKTNLVSLGFLFKT